MRSYAKNEAFYAAAVSAVPGHKGFTLLGLALAIWAAAVSPTLAQGPSAAVEAFAGEPLGVGRVTLQLPKQFLPEPLGIDGLGLSDTARPRAVSGHATVRSSAICSRNFSTPIRP